MRTSKLGVLTLAAMTLIPSTFANAATVGSNPWDNHHGETAPTKTVSTSNGKPCLVTGYRNVPLDENGITVNGFCFNNANEDHERLSPYAAVDATKTQDDLYKVQDTGIWGSGQQVARDTFAYQALPDNTPVLDNSQNINSQHLVYSRTINKWLTAENVNRSGAGQELIPTLTVDSSNPNQDYVEVVSRDNRALTNEATRRLTMGSRPIPTWYLKHPNPSGDKSLATYDTATGLWTSMFHVMQDAPAQTYSTTATIKLSEDGTVPNVTAWAGGKDKSARQKVNYDTAYFTSAPVEGKAQTVDAASAQLQAVPSEKTTAKDGLTPVDTPKNHVSPYSAGDTITVQAYSRDMESGRDMRYPVGRGQTFRLVNPVEGVSIDAHTGAITATRAAVEKAGGTLNVQVEADWTPVVKYSSGGYMVGKPNFGGLGENNYWLNLASGTSSVVGMANENTQIGIDELRSKEIKHALSVTFPNYQKGASFPAKMADGNMDTTKYPEAPHAGQRWRLPKDFDTEGYLRSIDKTGDEILRMQIEAAKKYGGIVTDRNLATIAFNFESGWSYAPAAREGKNIYMDATVENGWLKEMFDKHDGSNASFPWQAVQWMPVNYAELPAGSQGQQNTLVNYAADAIPGDLSVRTYLPDRVHENGYIGHTTHTGRDVRTYTVTDPFWVQNLLADFMETPGFSNTTQSDNGVVQFEELGITITPTREGVSTPLHLVTENLRKSKDYLAYEKLQDKSQWTGVAVPELDHTKSVIRQAGQEDVPVLDPKTKKWHFQAYANDPNYKSRAIPYTVGGVQDTNPLAASDYPRLKTGTTQIVDVLANDSTNYGNNNGMTMTGVKLYNAAGEEVTQYDDGMATYKVVDVPGKGRKGIEITTKTKEGFAPTVSYAAVRSDGTVSSKGAVTLLIGSTTGKAMALANRSAEKGEPAIQPTNPDQVVTEKGEPEVANSPEFTGGVNAVEAATNEVPEYTGGANAVEADSNKKDDFTGGVSDSEPTVREENPEYAGSVNGGSATAAPKGEDTTPTSTPVPTDSPKAPAVEPTNSGEGVAGDSDGSTTAPSEAVKPEQPSESSKPEEPRKPVEAKTGHEQYDALTSDVGLPLAGGLVAMLLTMVGLRRRRIEQD